MDHSAPASIKLRCQHGQHEWRPAGGSILGCFKGRDGSQHPSTHEARDASMDSSLQASTHTVRMKEENIPSPASITS
eukprot:1157003-Pelagomonas_calceolata.AAC.6